MGAIRKLSLLLFLLALGWLVADAQDMSWTGTSEDTTYFAKDFLPEPTMMTLPGPAQTWDFRSLKAPYAISRHMLVTGEENGIRKANVFSGNRTHTIVRLPESGVEVVQVVEPNPVCPNSFLTFTLLPAYKPFTSGVLGEQNVYSGKMVSTFSWPRNLACLWTPRTIPDSCRVTYTINEKSMVDAEGLLYLPTEIDKVNRQKVELKRALKVEVMQDGFWREVTAEIPGVRLITNTNLVRFFSATTEVQLVEMELDANRKPTRIEFKTHPIITRVFPEEPIKPDIFAYPNPSYDIVRFQMTNLTPGRYQLRIYNILGVPIKDVDVEIVKPRETIGVDLSDMQRGTYLFRLQDRSHHTIKTKRVVLIRS